MSKDPQLTEIATELEENSSVFQDSGNFTAESVSTGISHTSTQKDPNKDFTSNNNNDIQKPRNRSAPLLTSSGSSQGSSADTGNLNGDSSVDNGITTVCQNGNNLTSEKELEPSVDDKANLGRKTNGINGVVMPDKEDDEEELKSELNGADLSSEELNDMSTSMSSSVKTLTGEDSVDPIELNDCLNHIKTEDGSTSQPTTPTSAKGKGHRRTLSSDGSPSKRLIKSKSFNEGMSSSAHSGNTRMDRKHSNGSDTLRVIGQYLDIDGLTKSLDVFQNRILQLDQEHRAEVSKLHKQLDAERQARIALLRREQDPDCESPGRFSDLQDDVVRIYLVQKYFVHV